MWSLALVSITQSIAFLHIRVEEMMHIEFWFMLVSFGYNLQIRVAFQFSPLKLSLLMIQ
jgi:hypothetical protein